MSALPTEFIGLWERTELTLGGELVAGAGQTYWFQGPLHFVDVRGRGSDVPESAFAGTTTWDEPSQMLHWHHTIDRSPTTLADNGGVEWRDDNLVEHGSVDIAGESVPYVEVWCNRMRPEDTMTIARRVDEPGLLAICGDAAVVVVGDARTMPVRAGHATYLEGRWLFDVVIGPPGNKFGAAAGSVDGEFFSMFDMEWQRLDAG